VWMHGDGPRRRLGSGDGKRSDRTTRGSCRFYGGLGKDHGWLGALEKDGEGEFTNGGTDGTAGGGVGARRRAP
jgi:hypothetical protein